MPKSRLKEAIILAGGRGTRLSAVVADVPKPMALVNSRPFLEYLLDQLQEQAIERVILAVNYKREIIQEHFQDQYKGMEIAYSIEAEPLLTGGAIKQALEQCETPDVLVLNGDTYFAVDFQAMLQLHYDQRADITVAKKWLPDCSRYGTIVCEGERIVRFNEKCAGSRGYMNGGVYLLARTALQEIREQRFSFEKDVLASLERQFQLYAYASQGYFIDIGIPEDYHKAQIDLSMKLERGITSG